MMTKMFVRASIAFGLVSAGFAFRPTTESPQALQPLSVHQADLRRQFGLATSVIATELTVDSRTSLLGIPLSLAEQSEIARRDGVAQRAGMFDFKFRAFRNYGGVWIDQQHGGTAVLDTLGPPTRSMTAAFISTIGPGNTVRFDSVDASRQEIAVETARLVSLKAKLAQLGPPIQDVGPDVGRVLVGVGKPLTLAQREFLRVISPHAVVQVERSRPEAAYSRYSTAAPIYGGTNLKNLQTGGACTANVEGYATGPSGQVPYLLTAGHCGAVGSSIQVGGPQAYKNIGSVTYNGYYVKAGTTVTCDCALIRLNSSYSGTLTSASQYTGDYGGADQPSPYFFQRLATTNDFPKGSRVCFSGVQSGHLCGTTALVGPELYTYKDGTDVTGMQTTLTVKKGDSGAPVCNGTVLQGLVSGGKYPDGSTSGTAMLFIPAYQWKNLASFQTTFSG